MIISAEDILLFDPSLGTEKAEALVADAIAWAEIYAPCLKDEGFEHAEAAKAILRRAILREKDSGAGAVTSEQRTAGPYGSTVTVDARSRQGNSIFTDAEIDDLQRLCGEEPGKAFSIKPSWNDHDEV